VLRVWAEEVRRPLPLPPVWRKCSCQPHSTR
jgi:hypothetical protein